MAEKRTTFQKTDSNASDVVYEFNCIPCDQNGYNAEALYQCRICDKYFCEECNKMHTRILKEHFVLGIEDQLQWCDDRSFTSVDSGSYEDGQPIEKRRRLEDFSKHVFQCKQKYNIKVKNDARTCHVTGCCFMPDGTLLLADNSNRKLKLLSEEKYVMNTIDLPDQPSNVCYIGQDTVVVSLANKTVALVYVNKHDMRITEFIALEHECNYVEFHNETLYVADSQRIYMHSKDGKRKGVFYSNMSSGNIAVKCFTFSGDGSKMYITNQDKSQLVTLDNQGRTLATLSVREMRGAKGVCVSDNGTVFVCGYRSNSIVEVDSEGKRKLGTIGKADGMEWPLTACFDSSKSLLVVGLWKNDKILVYDFNAGTPL